MQSFYGGHPFSRHPRGKPSTSSVVITAASFPLEVTTVLTSTETTSFWFFRFYQSNGIPEHYCLVVFLFLNFDISLKSL